MLGYRSLQRSHVLFFVVFVSTVTNKKPSYVSVTKVKQFQGSSAFVKRSQWTIDQLRQVNGIDPNKVCNFLSYLFKPALYLFIRIEDISGLTQALLMLMSCSYRYFLQGLSRVRPDVRKCFWPVGCWFCRREVHLHPDSSPHLPALQLSAKTRVCQLSGQTVGG